MVRLEGAPELADDASDRICAALRPMDVVAEYAPGVLAVVMPERDHAATEDAARSLLDKARPRPAVALEVAVGVAGFPEHGTTPGALIARALAALESVRGRGSDLIGVPPAEAAPLLGEIVVADSQMARVYELVRKVADHPITVLVAGETGVGKEVSATARWCGSTAPRCPRPCSRASCSVTRRARSPAPTAASWATSRPRTAARCSSTRSAR
jgi:hypothetical protein